MTTSQATRMRRIRAFAKLAWLQQSTMTLLLSAIVGCGVGLLPVLLASGVDTGVDIDEMLPSGAIDLVAVGDEVVCSQCFDFLCSGDGTSPTLIRGGNRCHTDLARSGCR